MAERDRIQTEVARFTDFIGANKWTQLAKFTEEVGEALDDKNNPELFARELTDVVIVCLGLIHQAGLSFEDLFDEKMKINWEKYAEVPRLKQLGMNHGEAVGAIRKDWANRIISS